MSNLKTLLIILVVIFLVGLAGGEVYYLFFYQQKPAPTVPVVTKTTTSPEAKTNKQTPQQSAGPRISDIAINSAITFWTSTTKHVGKTVEIDTKGGVLKDQNLKYEVKLRVKGKGNIPNDLFLSKEDLNHIKVVQRVKDKEVPIKFSELKVGDSVIIDLTADFTKDPNNNLLEGKITKL